MKYLTGALIGAAVMVGGYALAATSGISGLSVVDRYYNVTKLYDSDANVVCYLNDNYGGGISCLKTN